MLNEPAPRTHVIGFKGHRVEKDIILIGVRWYLAYPLSYRHLEMMMKERGVPVYHLSLYRWVQKFTPQLETAFHNGKKRPVGKHWRMGETTYIQDSGPVEVPLRAVDKAGQTIDFLLTAHRDKPVALRFLKKAVRHHGLPDKVTLDKCGANTAALEALQEETDQPIERHQINYLNHVVEQDHRAIKRLTRPMLGFHAFRSTRITLQGIELMHMIKKGQRVSADRKDLSAAEHCYSLAS